MADRSGTGDAEQEGKRGTTHPGGIGARYTMAMTYSNA
jgi:hypothetical protein